MAKYKKKPVLPIYAIALVWVIYTLVHPLYQVSDYVSVILISVVVFIVAKGVFPTIEDGPAIPPELVHHAQAAPAPEKSESENSAAAQPTPQAPAAEQPEPEKKEKEAQAGTVQTAPTEPSPKEKKDSQD